MTKRKLSDILAFAKKNGLDLTGHLQWVPIADVASSGDPIDKQAVLELADLLESSREAIGDWPSTLPYPIIGLDGNEAVMVDGHHRLEAARELGWANVPAILVDLRSVVEITRAFRLSRTDYVQQVLVKTSKDVRASERRSHIDRR